VHRLHRTNAHTGRADRPCSLLSLILGGMRQRAFVVLDFISLPKAGFDMRDPGAVLDHEEPLPHPARDQVQ
jgi:hypothetical protein